jgi:hypothetical protein
MLLARFEKRLILPFQQWEKHHIANGRRTGEHHAKPVETDADAASGRHTVFEGFDEVVVHFLRFLARLGLEAGALDIGIVELGVAGRDFLAVDDELVNFHGFATWADFGEWDKLTGDAGDEARIEGLFLDELLEGLLDDFVIGHVLGNLDALFLAASAAASSIDFKEVRPGSLSDETMVTRSLPRPSKVDSASHIPLVILMLDLESAAEFLGKMAGKLLDHVRHFLEV